MNEIEKRSLYGSLITSVKEIMNSSEKKERELINEKAKIKVGGTIAFDDF